MPTIKLGMIIVGGFTLFMGVSILLVKGIACFVYH